MYVCVSPGNVHIVIFCEDIIEEFPFSSSFPESDHFFFLTGPFMLMTSAYVF